VYSYTVTLLNKNLQFVDGSTSETRQLTINQKVEVPTEDTTEAGSDPA
jgi:hypothetical protein